MSAQEVSFVDFLVECFTNAFNDYLPTSSSLEQACITALEFIAEDINDDEELTFEGMAKTCLQAVGILEIPQLVLNWIAEQHEAVAEVEAFHAVEDQVHQLIGFDAQGYPESSNDNPWAPFDFLE